MNMNEIQTDEIGYFANQIVDTANPYYGIDWSKEAQPAEIQTVEWLVSDGLAKANEGVSGAVASVQLQALTTGEHCVQCVLTKVGTGEKLVQPFRIIGVPACGCP